MKRLSALILFIAFAVFALTACSININITKNGDPTEPGVTVPSVGVPTEAATQALTEAPTQVKIGTVDDYVSVAQTNTVTFGDGNTNTLSIPKINIDSDDAKSVNSEIIDKFGEAVKGNQGAYAIDYESGMKGAALSVTITAKYDGGNSYGESYSFDVTTGKRLDNKALCELIGSDYNDAQAVLKKNLTAYYEDKYSTLPGNDKEKEKTLSDENVKSAKLYIDKDGRLTGLADVYAAVGGGHWIAQLSAEQ